MNDITYKDIIDQFGTERQCRQAMEECAELIQAINKALRYPNNSSTRLQLIEEIADVKIMIMQLEETFSISIPDDEAEKIATVGDAVRYIDEHVK